MASDYLPPKDLLCNQIILITGATSNIGREVALHCAAHQATVILLNRNIEALQALYDEIIANQYPMPAIYPFNLVTASFNDYQELRRAIDLRFGKLDGILHNAGMLGSLTPIEYYPAETWYQVLQLNLNSVFLLTQAVYPLLKKAQTPSIVLSTSTDKCSQNAHWGAYGVASAGCKALMQILAAEGRKIRVNQIALDNINTQFHLQAYPAANPNSLIEPKDIVNTFLYLLGHESADITGKNFIINQKKCNYMQFA